MPASAVGGWAVDALLEKQTRPHADLDLWVQAVHFDYAVVAFSRAGVDRLYPWGDDRPWNFVLHDDGGRRIDLHLYEVMRDDSGGVETGEIFPACALHGAGIIAGTSVC